MQFSDNRCGRLWAAVGGCEQLWAIRDVREVETLTSRELRRLKPCIQQLPPLRPQKLGFPFARQFAAGVPPCNHTLSSPTPTLDSFILFRTLPLSAAYATSRMFGHWEHWEHWGREEVQTSHRRKIEGCA